MYLTIKRDLLVRVENDNYMSSYLIKAEIGASDLNLEMVHKMDE